MYTRFEKVEGDSEGTGACVVYIEYNVSVF